ASIQVDRGQILATSSAINVEQRIWFNESANSTWFLVPGLMVLILTLIGAFLTGLLIARERERGTLEALFVTPVRPFEIVLAKLIPYIVV
ncbi:ABC transporter permease, partial [Acinetobacter baumannii]